ncbi:MAG: hypothetical protein RLZZ69_3834, partial [Cyanobacteriota bacterium]
AEHHAADAAEAVDTDLDRHVSLLEIKTKPKSKKPRVLDSAARTSIVMRRGAWHILAQNCPKQPL